jgi:hypothetical protein
LKQVTAVVSATLRPDVAVVGDAQRDVDGVGVRDFQRQLRIDAERLAGFERLGDGAEAAVERVPGDEHLIPGDVVGELELDARLAGAGAAPAPGARTRFR